MIPVIIEDVIDLAMEAVDTVPGKVVVGTTIAGLLTMAVGTYVASETFAAKGKYEGEKRGREISSAENLVKLVEQKENFEDEHRTKELINELLSMIIKEKLREMSTQ